MSDLSIAQKFNMPISKPTSINSNTNQINQCSKDGKGISTGVKVAIATSLVALASYGIYAVTRGKVKPKTAPITGNNTSVQKIKELSVNAFKEIGRFNKGRAVLADGTNYTGKIVSEPKDGSKFVMEYLDGVLQKSTKIKGSETVFEKTYKYSDELGLVNVIKNKSSVLKKFVDEAGNLNIVTSKHHNVIDKSTGLIRRDCRFIDKHNNISGSFETPYCIRAREGGINYPLKIKGTEVQTAFLDPMSGGVGNLEKGECNLVWNYRGRKNDGDNVFHIDTIYRFNSSGKSMRNIDLYGRYGKYKKLDFDFKSGFVTNGESPLFKYNYKTNEITDLKIDKNEAEELVNFAKEQYGLYQKAQKARLREYKAVNI